MRRGAAALIGLFLLCPAPAWAHGAVMDSNPKNGSEVDSPPAEVWVEFTERPHDNAELRVTDACDRRVDDGRVRLTPAPNINQGAGEIPYRVTIGVTATHPSRYTLSWTVTWPSDGHTTTGSISYTVRGQAEPCTQAATGPVSAPGASAAPKVTARPARAASATAAPTVLEPVETEEVVPELSRGEEMLSASEPAPQTQQDRSPTSDPGRGAAGLLALGVLVLGAVPMVLSAVRPRA